MEKIILEKVITFSSTVENLVKASLKDSLNYQLADDGVSAIGVIKITGSVQTIKGFEDFNENLDVDIFAPFEQIIDKSKFSLKIEDFSYQIIRNNLIFKIEVSVNGFRKINQDSTPNSYNLTNEIDEEISEVKNMYDQELINDLKDQEDKTPLEALIEQISQENNITPEIISFEEVSQRTTEKKDEVETIEETIEEIKQVDETKDVEETEISEKESMEENDKKLDKINIKLTSSDEKDELAKSWADDLFKLKDSYVLFYRIHRLMDGETSKDGEKFIILNEVKQ